MQGNDESNEWSDLRSAIELRSAGLASSELVADAIQEALLVLVMARAAGEVIRDEVGWCLVIVRRRVMDAHRRQRREVVGLKLERVPVAEEPAVDWGRVLRKAGIEVTDEGCELLARIASGFRGNRALARCLGRDVKTIRERRARLQGLLRRAYREFFRAPPLERPIGAAVDGPGCRLIGDSLLSWDEVYRAQFSCQLRTDAAPCSRRSDEPACSR